MADDNKLTKEQQEEQDYLDEMFEPGELEKISAYHRNEKGVHDPKLPPDWTDADSEAAKERIEKAVGGLRTFKVELDRDGLVSLITNQANVPVGYPVAKESMKLSYDTRFNNYDEIRDWFVERGFDIPEAELSAELDPGYLGTYDDVFEEMQTYDIRESFEGQKDEIMEAKRYLEKLKELGVTRIDRDYHRTRRSYLAEDSHGHELALRMQRHNPDTISVDNGIYAHDVDTGDLECPKELMRSDYNRHLINPDNLDYVGHEDNREKDDPMGPTKIPDILSDLDDYAPGGPKQYKGPVNEEEDSLKDSDVNDNYLSGLYDDEDEDEESMADMDPERYVNNYERNKSKGSSTTNPYSSSAYSPKKSSENNRRPRDHRGGASNLRNQNKRRNRNPASASSHYAQQPMGRPGINPSDILGVGALAGMVGSGVKGAVDLIGKGVTSGSNKISDIRSTERANGMADIAINEMARANSSAKDALERVSSNTNKSGEPASAIESAQNIAELDISLVNLGEKLKMGESSAKNSRVDYDSKKEILKNIGEAGELVNKVSELPEDKKSQLSKKALDIAKLIADMISNLFRRNKSSTSAPSM